MADGLIAINTVKGLAIDIETGYPLLSHGIVGCRSRAIKPIGVRCVYELAKNKDIKIPIIGCGGVFDWQDVVEYMMAVQRVSLGSAFIDGVQVVPDINLRLSKYVESKSLNSITDIIGKSLNFKMEDC